MPLKQGVDYIDTHQSRKAHTNESLQKLVDEKGYKVISNEKEYGFIDRVLLICENGHKKAVYVSAITANESLSKCKTCGSPGLKKEIKKKVETNGHKFIDIGLDLYRDNDYVYFECKYCGEECWEKRRSLNRSNLRTKCCKKAFKKEKE